MKLVLGRSQEGGTCQIFLQIPDTYVLLLIRLLLAHLHIIRTLNPFFFFQVSLVSQNCQNCQPPRLSNCGPLVSARFPRLELVLPRVFQ